MLAGTADPKGFERDAPTMPSFAENGVEFPNAVFVQALFEIEAASMCEMLPPALHPTLPPVAGITVLDVPESEWGPFRMAELRIQCRSGLRSRAMGVSTVVDRAEVGVELAERFGFRVVLGEVALERAYHETRIEVGAEGATWASAAMRGPKRIGEGDMQFVSTMHPAQTPVGFRLVQLDTRYGVQRAERAPLDLEVFDAAAWGESRIVPSLMLPAVVGIADVRLDAIRFACRAEVMAFEGSEKVGAR